MFWGRCFLWVAPIAPIVALVDSHISAAVLVGRVVLALSASVVFGAIGVSMVSYGRRLQVPAGEGLVVDKERSTVLYLRSFSIDSNGMPGLEAAQATLPTAEEALAERLSALGEMVAVGRPGEPLPPIGVPRIYRDDETWRAAVLDLMRRSRLTFLVYGASPGLRWEISSAIENVPAERLLFLFQTRELWRDFRELAGTNVEWLRRLPSTRADVHLLAFYPDGAPRVLEVHGKSVINDFSSEFYPDATEPGEVSPGGLEAYVETLSTVRSDASTWRRTATSVAKRG